MIDISFDELLLGLGLLIVAIMVTLAFGSPLATIGLGLVAVGLMIHGLFNMPLARPPLP